MKVTIRIPRRLLVEMENDLDRPHEFAKERLGFVLARWAQSAGELVVIPFEYISIADEAIHRLYPYVSAPQIEQALELENQLADNLSKRAA